MLVNPRSFWRESDETDSSSAETPPSSPSEYPGLPSPDTHMFRVEVPVASAHPPPRAVLAWVEAQCRAVSCPVDLVFVGLRSAVSRPGFLKPAKGKGGPKSRRPVAAHGDAAFAPTSSSAARKHRTAPPRKRQKVCRALLADDAAMAESDDEREADVRPAGGHLEGAAQEAPESTRTYIATITPPSVVPAKVEAFASKRGTYVLARGPRPSGAARPPAASAPPATAPAAATPVARFGEMLRTEMSNATGRAMRSSAALRAVGRMISDLVPAQNPHPPAGLIRTQPPTGGTANASTQAPDEDRKCHIVTEDDPGWLGSTTGLAFEGAKQSTSLPANTPKIRIEVHQRLLARLAPRHVLVGSAALEAMVPERLWVDTGRYGVNMLPPTAVSRSCGSCLCFVVREGGPLDKRRMESSSSAAARTAVSCGGASLPPRTPPSLRTPPRVSEKTPAATPSPLIIHTLPAYIPKTTHLLPSGLLRVLEEPSAATPRRPGFILSVDVTTTDGDIDAVRDAILLAFHKVRAIDCSTLPTPISLAAAEREALSAAVFAAYPDTALFFETTALKSPPPPPAAASASSSTATSAAPAPAASRHPGVAHIAFACGLAAGLVESMLRPPSPDAARAECSSSGIVQRARGAVGAGGPSVKTDAPQPRGGHKRKRAEMEADSGGEDADVADGVMSEEELEEASETSSETSRPAAADSNATAPPAPACVSVDLPPPQDNAVLRTPEQPTGVRGVYPLAQAPASGQSGLLSRVLNGVAAALTPRGLRRSTTPLFPVTPETVGAVPPDGPADKPLTPPAEPEASGPAAPPAPSVTSNTRPSAPTLAPVVAHLRNCFDGGFSAYDLTTFPSAREATGCVAAAAQYATRTKLWCHGRRGKPGENERVAEPLTGDILRSLAPELCWLLTAAKRVGLSRMKYRRVWYTIRGSGAECVAPGDVYESCMTVDILQIGDLVKLRTPIPRTYVRDAEVGEVTAVYGHSCTVRFRSNTVWHGLVADLEHHTHGDAASDAGAACIGLVGTPVQRAAAVEHITALTARRVELVPVPRIHMDAIMKSGLKTLAFPVPIEVRAAQDGIVAHGPPPAIRVFKSCLRHMLLFVEAQTVAARWGQWVKEAAAASSTAVGQMGVCLPPPAGVRAGTAAADDVATDVCITRGHFAVASADVLPAPSGTSPRVPKTKSQHRASSLLLWTSLDDFCNNLRKHLDALPEEHRVPLADTATASLGANPSKQLVDVALRGMVPRAGDVVRVFDEGRYRVVVSVDDTDCRLRGGDRPKDDDGKNMPHDTVKVMAVHLPFVADIPPADTMGGPFSDPRNDWDTHQLSGAGIQLPAGLNDEFPTPARRDDGDGDGDGSGGHARTWWKATIIRVKPPTEASDAFPCAVYEWVRDAVRGGRDIGRPTLLHVKALFNGNRSKPYVVVCPLLGMFKVDPCLPDSSTDRLRCALHRIVALKWKSLIDEYLFDTLRTQLAHLVSPQHLPQLARAKDKAQRVIAEIAQDHQEVRELICPSQSMRTTRASPELQELCERQLEDVVRDWRQHMQLTAYELAQFAERAARGVLQEARERGGAAIAQRIAKDAEVMILPRRAADGTAANADGGAVVEVVGRAANMGIAARRLRAHAASLTDMDDKSITLRLEERQRPWGEGGSTDGNSPTDARPPVRTVLDRLAGTGILADMIATSSGATALDVSQSTAGEALVVTGTRKAIVKALQLLGLGEYSGYVDGHDLAAAPARTTADVMHCGVCGKPVPDAGAEEEEENEGVGAGGVELLCGHRFHGGCLAKCVSGGAGLGAVCPVPACGHRLTLGEHLAAGCGVPLGSVCSAATTLLAGLPQCPNPTCGRHFAPPHDYPQRCPDCLGGTPLYPVLGWEGHISCAGCNMFPLPPARAYTCLHCLFVQLCEGCAARGCGNPGHKMVPLEMIKETSIGLDHGCFPDRVEGTASYLAPLQPMDMDGPLWHMFCVERTPLVSVRGGMVGGEYLPMGVADDETIRDVL